MKSELIIQIGAEGGSLSAYRIIDKDGNYTFQFGTNEIGLSFDEDGISTHSENQINSIGKLLQTMRKTYPEIYNLLSYTFYGTILILIKLIIKHYKNDFNRSTKIYKNICVYFSCNNKFTSCYN